MVDETAHKILVINFTSLYNVYSMCMMNVEFNSLSLKNFNAIEMEASIHLVFKVIV